MAKMVKKIKGITCVAIFFFCIASECYKGSLVILGR